MQGLAISLPFELVSSINGVPLSELFSSPLTVVRSMESAIKTDYPFLAHPPSSLSQPPLGTRRRSSTFSAIATWAAHVQPGSPAALSPCSPHRRLSLRKGRRPSIATVCPPSASFLHIAPTPTTATPTARNFKADLTTVGYTSVFLHLPNSPVSATLAILVNPSSQSTSKNIPVPPVPTPTRGPRGLARFRSLSALRSRGRSKSACPDTPTKMTTKATATSTSVTKRKKAKYAPRPPPLVNELALMQFADGGSMDNNIKRVMDAQAKATGAVGLDDIYRDGKGGVWWDQDEEYEYAHLLAEGDESRPRVTAGGDLQWVTFGGNMSPSTMIPGDDRRGSLSTQDSDLDPKYIVRPTEALDGDNLGGSIVPLATRKPISVLSLPCRPRRAAMHLQKPNFLVDAAFSRLHDSLRSPSSSSSMEPKRKARRRPAPLKLFPPSPAAKRPTNSPIDADRVRKDFIEASFEPVISVSVPATPTAALRSQPVECNPINVSWRSVNDGLRSLGMSMKRKPSALNMMSLFRSAPARKEDVMAR